MRTSEPDAERHPRPFAAFGQATCERGVPVLLREVGRCLPVERPLGIGTRREEQLDALAAAGLRGVRKRGRAAEVLCIDRHPGRDDELDPGGVGVLGVPIERTPAESFLLGARVSSCS